MSEITQPGGNPPANQPTVFIVVGGDEATRSYAARDIRGRVVLTDAVDEFDRPDWTAGEYQENELLDAALGYAEHYADSVGIEVESIPG